MKLSADKLPSHLAKGLAGVYMVGGDDPLLVGEATDALRATARSQGYSERELHVAQRDFDWSQLTASTASLSLFASRRIVELRLPTGKPGREGGKAIQAFVSKPPQDTLLLIVTPKIDRKTAAAAWVKAVEAAGVLVQVWPVAVAQMPRWIDARMRQAGLVPDRDAVRLLAGRTEGNLLAAAQEIDKLKMLNGSGPIDEQAVRRAVADSARYDIFDLSDAALGGQTARALHVLDGLRGEGVEPVLILWALARELATLTSVCHRVDRGASVDSAVAASRVWQNRRSLVASAARRCGSGAHASAMLIAAARTDRVIKGAATGEPWNELTGLVAAMCGVRVGAAAA